MRTHPRLLVVDDDPALCRLVAHGMEQHGFDVTWACSAERARTTLAAADFDVVVADLELPGLPGLEFCAEIVRDRRDLPVVILTSSGNLEAAVGAIRAGACDFLVKPPEMEALAAVLERAVHCGRTQEGLRRLRNTVADHQRFEEIVTSCPAMHAVTELLARIAPSDCSVLITGESGTGKDVVARALHRGSDRAHGPFVAVNCAAVPEHLLEAELFGHVRGAFSGAIANRTGLFPQAHGGTLFLDEIGELPPTLQPKLLRALQERTVRPIGADTEVTSDVRLVAATNQDLEAATRDRRFRADLLFRIDVVRLHLPPLRTRGDDVLLLAQLFVQRFAARAKKPIGGFSPGVAEHLLAHAWPGNVRELQNCVERAVILARYDRITVDDLPDHIRKLRPTRRHVAAAPDGDVVSLPEIERRHILAVLEAVHGNRKEAARLLGVDRKTLYRRLRQYERPETRVPGRSGTRG